MNKDIIERTIAYVRSELSGIEAGHDWEHVKRVWRLAKYIAESEKVDVFVVELGALLHDIADSKFHGGSEDVGPEKAANFLISLHVDEMVIDQVVKIIKNISYKGGNHVQEFKSPELDVIQDADRLDAMGAIGIARTFNFGGYKNRPLYDPEIRPDLNMDKETYKQRLSPTINHFYEKLFLLKDRMNTAEGKRLAQDRHSFMVEFVDRFFEEWDF